MMLIKLLHRDT